MSEKFSRVGQIKNQELMKQMNIRQAKIVEKNNYRVGNDSLKNNTLEFYGQTVCVNVVLVKDVATVGDGGIQQEGAVLGFPLLSIGVFYYTFNDMFKDLIADVSLICFTW